MTKLHEIRWNPLIKQWIIVAEHRSMRPWRPEEKREAFKCPFCPGAPELAYLESWNTVSLPNKYPALLESPPSPSREELKSLKAGKAKGECRVVIETPEHEGDLHTLSLEHAVKVIELFKEEYVKLSSRSYVRYVAIFRNKGKEIGVSLTHPHSQIYALPFTPPRIKVELESMREYHESEGRCMICDIAKYELSTGRRTIYENEHYVALLPFYAMWPYEVHVYPKRHINSIKDLSEEECIYLADVLRVVTATYTALLERDAPYIMVFHNPPVKGRYEHYHFHVEFYQPYREKDKFKHAAGIEWGFWVFTYDGLPEKKAGELREACKKAVGGLGDVLGKCK
ncbi:MAG: galactose-1-phosphate uridylyltransferase [Desulfurococcaceae archaeon]